MAKAKYTANQVREATKLLEAVSLQRFTFYLFSSRFSQTIFKVGVLDWLAPRGVRLNNITLPAAVLCDWTITDEGYITVPAQAKESIATTLLARLAQPLQYSDMPRIMKVEWF